MRISHVLEHIPEPRDFLDQLHRVLKPSGILVVIVPNREPLCAMFVNRYRQLFSKKPKLAGAIYPDMHVLGFSTKSLTKLVRSIKFNTISCFTVSMGNTSYYPQVLNPAIKIYNLSVLPRQNLLSIENRVINCSNLVSPIPMHNLDNILKILTFNTSACINI